MVRPGIVADNPSPAVVAPGSACLLLSGSGAARKPIGDRDIKP
jgi:hypothetical protein